MHPPSSLPYLRIQNEFESHRSNGYHETPSLRPSPLSAPPSSLRRRWRPAGEISRRVDSDKEPRWQAREEDRGFRGGPVRQEARSEAEAGEGDQGGEAGGGRVEFPAGAGDEGRIVAGDEELRGGCVGEAMGAFHESYFV